MSLLMIYDNLCKRSAKHRVKDLKMNQQYANGEEFFGNMNKTCELLFIYFFTKVVIKPRSYKRSDTLFQKSLLLFSIGESTSTASQKSKTLSQTLLCILIHLVLLYLSHVT